MIFCAKVLHTLLNLCKIDSVNKQIMLIMPLVKMTKKQHTKQKNLINSGVPGLREDELI